MGPSCFWCSRTLLDEDHGLPAGLDAMHCVYCDHLTWLATWPQGGRFSTTFADAGQWRESARTRVSRASFIRARIVVVAGRAGTVVGLLALLAAEVAAMIAVRGDASFPNAEESFRALGMVTALLGPFLAAGVVCAFERWTYRRALERFLAAVPQLPGISSSTTFAIRASASPEQVAILSAAD